MSYQLLPNVHRIQYGFTEYGSNIGGYLIVDEELALIDAGNSPDSLEKVADYIQEEINRSPEELKFIFLTHGHPEQITGLSKAEKNFPEVEILAEKSLAIQLESPRDFLKKRAFRLPGYQLGYLAKKVEKVPKKMKISGIKSSKPVKIGSSSILPVHVSGHSYGHTIYFHKETKSLFIGDALYVSINDPTSIVIDSSGSVKSFIKTIEFFENASFKALCPASEEPVLSHGKSTVSDVKQSFQNMYMQGIKGLLGKKGNTLYNIQALFLNRFSPNYAVKEGKDYLTMTIAKILDYLVETGHAKKTGDDWSNYEFSKV